MENNRLELLSPAGSFESAKMAIESGADAIYMGASKFNARAFAKSAEENSTVEAIKLAKSNGKKFYLTVNVLFKQKELREIFLILDEIVPYGVDAFIVQDLGVAGLLKERYKEVELHASTQMTITSSKSINLLKKLGFVKFVLARELSAKEIKKIKKEIGDEVTLEAFVHGSMCYSYSGACLMSSFIGGESGNRGRCKGPCRLPYKSINNAKNNYLLSMKDMCTINILNKLVGAGVSSFKIEGRMRKPDYVKAVTATYRKYLDMILDDNFPKEIDKCFIKDEKLLLDVYDKGGFTNYYDKHNSNDMIQKIIR